MQAYTKHSSVLSILERMAPRVCGSRLLIDGSRENRIETRGSSWIQLQREIEKKMKIQRRNNQKSLPEVKFNISSTEQETSTAKKTTRNRLSDNEREDSNILLCTSLTDSSSVRMESASKSFVIESTEYSSPTIQDKEGISPRPTNYLSQPTVWVEDSIQELRLQ